MGRRVESIVVTSIEETVAFGKELGQQLPQGAIVSLLGELGAGKTTLVKGIVEGATGLSGRGVTSPTFTYLNIYGHLFHFDLYRLKDAEEFLSMGFEEYLFSEGICCIEWSERIEALLPLEVYKVTLSHRGEGSRLVEYEVPTL